MRDFNFFEELLDFRRDHTEPLPFYIMDVIGGIIANIIFLPLWIALLPFILASILCEFVSERKGQ